MWDKGHAINLLVLHLVLRFHCTGPAEVRSRYIRQALHLTEVRPKSVVLIVQIAQIISDGRMDGRTDEGLTISRQTL